MHAMGPAPSVGSGGNHQHRGQFRWPHASPGQELWAGGRPPSNLWAQCSAFPVCPKQKNMASNHRLKCPGTQATGAQCHGLFTRALPSPTQGHTAARNLHWGWKSGFQHGGSTQCSGQNCASGRHVTSDFKAVTDQHHDLEPQRPPALRSCQALRSAWSTSLPPQHSSLSTAAALSSQEGFRAAGALARGQFGLGSEHGSDGWAGAGYGLQAPNAHWVATWDISMVI